MNQGYRPAPPAATAAQAAPGVLQVRKTYEDGKMVDAQETIVVREFLTNPASVTVKFGSTIQPRAFETIKIEAMVTLPCYVEEVPEVIKHAASIAATFVVEEEQAIRAEIAGATGKKPGEPKTLDEFKAETAKAPAEAPAAEPTSDDGWD
jgi:hypothetical protein